MEESTGETAQTLHKAMQLSHLEDGTYCAPKMLEADLVLVDEVSMMDAFLAERLLEALPEGCQLVLIGGRRPAPQRGARLWVLRELIASGQISVVRLTKIYRQHAGSRIAIDAALIRTGNLHLEYGSDFVFVEKRQSRGFRRHDGGIVSPGGGAVRRGQRGPAIPRSAKSRKRGWTP